MTYTAGESYGNGTRAASKKDCEKASNKKIKPKYVGRMRLAIICVVG